MSPGKTHRAKEAEGPSCCTCKPDPENTANNPARVGGPDGAARSAATSATQHSGGANRDAATGGFAASSIVTEVIPGGRGVWYLPK